jgi:hypothetical protein
MGCVPEVRLGMRMKDLRSVSMRRRMETGDAASPSDDPVVLIAQPPNG